MTTTDQALRAPGARSGADPFGLHASIKAALARAPQSDAPYRHWILTDMFTPEALAALRALPKYAVDLHGVSGKRELHNDQRHYFDQPATQAHPICKAVADAFQSADIVAAFEDKTGASLSGTYVRLEHAHDGDGFWLQPHTDLGVKYLTLLCALPNDPSQADLGTDIYANEKTWAKRSPFVEGAALLFVPGANTWHGFERRPISGLRSSLIMNYVTTEWRAREQLAFADTPVTSHQ